MKTVGVYEAKSNLTKLLALVEAGERVTITRHGTPIAELVPPARTRRRTPEEAVAAIKEFRKSNRLNGLTIRELIDEGRR
ncbi:MAG: type II toxin-antitoxin system prevent-host-death family antitoxin [Alphaproteobacteria bacterium]|nr:type II toxin-antitoxin system prevent-host-death family antitoxin [Alphaproteobacteria bacterium]